MKIYESNIDVEVYQKLFTKNPLKLLQNVEINNKNAIILTPLSLVSDVFNLNKDSIINSFINSVDVNFKNKMINEKILITLINELNQSLNIDYVEMKLEYNKLLKNFLEFKQIYVDHNNIIDIIDFLNKYTEKNLNVFIFGFDKLKMNKFFDNINIIHVVNDIFGQVSYDEINNLLIDNNKEIIEIYGQEVLHNWLETQTKTVLTNSDINDFVSGKTTFNTFLMDKAMKNI